MLVLRDNCLTIWNYERSLSHKTFINFISVVTMVESVEVPRRELLAASGRIEMEGDGNSYFNHSIPLISVCLWFHPHPTTTTTSFVQPPTIAFF